jgi:hypothetical protein
VDDSLVLAGLHRFAVRVAVKSGGVPRHFKSGRSPCEVSTEARRIFRESWVANRAGEDNRILKPNQGATMIR